MEPLFRSPEVRNFLGWVKGLCSFYTHFILEIKSPRSARVFLMTFRAARESRMGSFSSLVGKESLWGKFRQVFVSWTDRKASSVCSFLFFCLFRVTPTAYGGSQANGRIWAIAVALRHNHSNTRSLTHWVRPGIKPASSWILVRFVSTEPRQQLHQYALATRLFSHVDNSIIPVFSHLNFCGQWGVKMPWPISHCVHLRFLSAWLTPLHSLVGSSCHAVCYTHCLSWWNASFLSSFCLSMLIFSRSP